MELRATVETVRWSRAGVSRTEPWEVHCVVGANSWQMDGRFLEGAKTACWFTGTNIMVHHELVRPAAPGQTALRYRDGPDLIVQVPTASGVRWTTSSASADGNPGRPVRTVDLLTLPGRIAWLAFCSGPCLRHDGRRLYPPSDLWKELVTAPAGFNDRTVVFDDGLSLPKSVRLETAERLPILQYGVANSTNVLGWEFPLEFHLVQYRPVMPNDPGNAEPHGWEIDFAAKGVVTAIGPGEKPEIPPEATQAFNE